MASSVESERGIARGLGLFACNRVSRADARREKLICAARTLFADHGFHNTGIAQIARHSGVLVGQIYRDFASKEEIVAEIVERDLDLFLADGELCAAIEAQDAAAVRGWIRHFVEGNSVADHRLVAEIIAESVRNDRIGAIFRGLQDRLSSRIHGALEMLAPEPAKQRARTVLAEVILTISAGLFHRRLGQPDLDPTLIRALAATLDRELDALIGSAAPA